MKKRAIITALCSLTLAAIGMFGLSNTAGASSVNDYIANNNIDHAEITSSIWGGFPKNAYRKGTGKPEGVVVHETANPNSTIYNEIAYMKKNYNNAFVHTFVDASRIINIANTNYLSWGAGYPANARFVQFEQVEVHSKSAFAHEIANAAYYTAYILNQYGLKPNDAAYDGKGTVWSHGGVSKYLGGTNHTDPAGYYASAGKKYFGSSYTFAQFYQLVKTTYNNLAADGAAHSSLTASSAKKAYDKVTYAKADSQASLGDDYKSYRLYNHVKNSRSGVKSYSWDSVKASVGKKVYIDNIGTKSNGHDWYRVTFSTDSGAQKYWVYEKALNLIN